MPVQDCNATWIWISLFERTPGCAWTNTFRHHLDTAEIGILLASVPFVFCADILDSLQCLQAPDTSPNRTLNCAFFASASNENRQAPISPKQTNKIKLELDIIYGRQKIRTTLYINHDPHTSHALTELPLLWPLLWTESTFDKDVYLYNSYHFIKNWQLCNTQFALFSW